MVRCPKCFSPNEDGALRCSACGAAITRATSTLVGARWDGTHALPTQLREAGGGRFSGQAPSIPGALGAAPAPVGTAVGLRVPADHAEPPAPAPPFAGTRTTFGIHVLDEEPLPTETGPIRDNRATTGAPPLTPVGSGTVRLTVSEALRGHDSAQDASPALRAGAPAEDVWSPTWSPSRDVSGPAAARDRMAAADATLHGVRLQHALLGEEQADRGSTTDLGNRTALGLGAPSEQPVHSPVESALGDEWVADMEAFIDARVQPALVAERAVAAGEKPAQSEAQWSADAHSDVRVAADAAPAAAGFGIISRRTRRKAEPGAVSTPVVTAGSADHRANAGSALRRERVDLAPANAVLPLPAEEPPRRSAGAPSERREPSLEYLVSLPEHSGSPRAVLSPISVAKVADPLGPLTPRAGASGPAPTTSWGNQVTAASPVASHGPIARPRGEALPGPLGWQPNRAESADHDAVGNRTLALSAAPVDASLWGGGGITPPAAQEALAAGPAAAFDFISLADAAAGYDRGPAAGQPGRDREAPAAAAPAPVPERPAPASAATVGGPTGEKLGGAGRGSRAARADEDDLFAIAQRSGLHTATPNPTVGAAPARKRVTTDQARAIAVVVLVAALLLVGFLIFRSA